MCDTAHELETPVMAHARSADSTRACAEAGVDLILHTSFMDEAGLEAVVDAGAALMPTFTFLANLAGYGHLVGAGEGMQDVFRGEIEATANGAIALRMEGEPVDLDRPWPSRAPSPARKWPTGLPRFSPETCSNSGVSQK